MSDDIVVYVNLEDDYDVDVDSLYRAGWHALDAAQAEQIQLVRFRPRPRPVRARAPTSPGGCADPPPRPGPTRPPPGPTSPRRAPWRARVSR